MEEGVSDIGKHCASILSLNKATTPQPETRQTVLDRLTGRYFGAYKRSDNEVKPWNGSFH